MSWLSRTDRIAELLGVQPAYEADRPLAMAAGTAPPTAPAPAPNMGKPLLDWFTQVTLLYGVPFEYLVADPRLLPPESLRFFYVDANWTDRLIDGALSVATISTAETVFNEQLIDAIYAAIDENQQALRSELRGKNDERPGDVLTGGTYTGLLLRSVVVSGWPGLEIKASKAGSPVALLRMDRLAPDLLLVLFADVPDEVDLIEPSEGLNFGVTDRPGGPGQMVYLRSIGVGPTSAGNQLYTAGQTTVATAAASMRMGTGQPAGVVDVDALVGSITTALRGLKALGADSLTPGEFAVQMVKTAGRQPYTLDGKRGFDAGSGG